MNKDLLLRYAQRIVSDDFISERFSMKHLWHASDANIAVNNWKGVYSYHAACIAGWSCLMHEADHRHIPVWRLVREHASHNCGQELPVSHTFAQELLQLTKHEAEALFFPERIPLEYWGSLSPSQAAQAMRNLANGVPCFQIYRESRYYE